MSDFTPILKENYKGSKKRKIAHYAEGGSVDAASSAEPEGLDTLLNDHSQYETVGQQALAGLEGTGRGVLGPVATYAETHSGLTTPEAIRGRQEANPVTSALGETAGFAGSILSGAGVGSAIAHAGESVAAHAIPDAASISAKIGSKALQAATEMGLLSTSDEASKLIEQDPNQSAQTAIANIGLSSALGAGLGTALGSVSPLWKATGLGDSLGKTLGDFRGEISNIRSDADSVENVKDELTHLYQSDKDLLKGFRGEDGVRAQNLEAAMPKEITPEIETNLSNMSNRIDKSLDRLGNDPLAGNLHKQTDIWKNTTTPSIDPITLQPTKEVNPLDAFNAGNKLKAFLQDEADYEHLPSLQSKNYINEIKSLAHDLRISLEDSDAWGKAGDFQKETNNLIASHIPAMRDFEKRFTDLTEVGGRQMSASKINTYMNQLGKPNAEIKQQVLKNILDSSDSLRAGLNKAYANVGLESPVKTDSLAAVRKSLEEITPGRKLAQLIFKKALPDGASKLLGGGVGGLLGHAFGLGEMGTILGTLGAGPAIEKVLPAILKPLLGKEVNGVGLKAASDYGVEVVKGEQLLSKAAKNIFKAGSEVLPEHALPTERSRMKLDEQLKDIRKNPNKLLQTANADVAHYLPEHNIALKQATTNAAGYLNGIRPEPYRKGPLDPLLPPNEAQKANYKNALNIAQQPLILLDKIKQGTITPQDIAHQKAMYPDLYNRISQKLMTEIINQTSKGNTIPYKTRLGVSMYTGQPLDSSMSPASIMSAQAALVSPLGQQQPQGAQQQGEKAKYSTTSLNKLPNTFRTPAQTNSQRHQSNE